MGKVSPRALVTGASSGIGTVYAQHLARTGHDLVVVARREDRLTSLAKTLQEAHGIEVEIIVADLASSEGTEIVCDRLRGEPPIDILVNNAGFATRGKVAEFDAKAFERMIQVDVIALSHLSNAAMAKMTSRGSGSIINVGSITAFLLFPGNAGYGASKSFVTSFTRHMQMEAAGSGVRVQLLVPGIVATDFHEVAGGNLANYAPERIMKPDDLVVASLRALEMNEPVCIPSLPDIRDWNAFVEVEGKIAANGSRDRTAPRYH